MKIWSVVLYATLVLGFLTSNSETRAAVENGKNADKTENKIKINEPESLNCLSTPSTSERIGPEKKTFLHRLARNFHKSVLPIYVAWTIFSVAMDFPGGTRFGLASSSAIIGFHFVESLTEIEEIQIF